ncbi:hypothetical protein JCM5350_005493 [Sporobolomyces pararoseus]
MPLPFLPPELISEIISHLRNEDDVDEQVRDGKAVSLVCKSWKRLGQALRWRFLSISPARIPSLTEHFNRHPQLPTLAKAFEVLFHYGEGKHADATYNSLIAMISIMYNLQTLVVVGRRGLNYLELLKVSSKLRDLEQCQIRLIDGYIWKSEANLMLRSGFKKLQTFALDIGFFATLESPPMNLLAPPLAITGLELAVRHPSDGSPILGLRDRYFSNFDPTTLRWAKLGLTAINFESLSWLSSCPLLQSLEIDLRDPLVRLKFPEIILFLPRFLALDDFRCSIKVARTGDLEEVNSPVSLLAVLNSFPPSLSFFEANELIFPDYNVLSRRPHPTIRTEDLLSLSALRPDDEEEGKVVPLSIWGEKAEGGGGRIEWYRDPDEDVDTACEYYTSVSISVDLDR